LTREIKKAKEIIEQIVAEAEAIIGKFNQYEILGGFL